MTIQGYGNALGNISVMQTSVILKTNCPFWPSGPAFLGIGDFGALQLMARALHNVFINVT